MNEVIMSKIYFRNSANWSKVFALIDDEKIELSFCDADGNFVCDFDNTQHLKIHFENELGEKTGIVYPGAISLGVDYKKNDKMGKSLTYLFANNIENTGRVDNYELLDECNLAHREDKSKKISVFIPSTYDGVTPHDILYFFDAQNLYGSAGKYTDNGDPYGSWQLDLIACALKNQFDKNIIIVGIDNADKYRDKELFMNPCDFGDLAPLATALPDEDYSVGYLDYIDDFIKQTLHPFIIEKYCVKEDNIGIGGASMGGIASFYCGLREPGFYNYVLSYSPAFGLYEMSAFENWFSNKCFTNHTEELPYIHIYCGEGDPLERLLIGSSRDMKKALMKYGYSEEKIFETFDIEKPHNEESWRQILGKSFTELLKIQTK